MLVTCALVTLCTWKPARNLSEVATFAEVKMDALHFLSLLFLFFLKKKKY